MLTLTEYDKAYEMVHSKMNTDVALDVFIMRCKRNLPWATIYTHFHHLIPEDLQDNDAILLGMVICDVAQNKLNDNNPEW